MASGSTCRIFYAKLKVLLELPISDGNERSLKCVWVIK